MSATNFHGFAQLQFLLILNLITQRTFYDLNTYLRYHKVMVECNNGFLYQFVRLEINRVVCLLVDFLPHILELL